MGEIKVLIDNGCVKECQTKNTRVELPEGENILTVYGDKGWEKCENMHELVIPEGVKEIGFFEAKQPLTIWLPDSIEEMDCLFSDETRLDRIVCSENKAIEICAGKVGSLSAMSGHRTLLQINGEGNGFKIVISESYSPTCKLKCSLSVKNNKFDFAAYDEILSINKKYKLSQEERILAMLCRLAYPKGLDETYKNEYSSYISKNIKKTIPIVLEQNDPHILKCVLSLENMTEKNKKEIIKKVLESKNPVFLDVI